MASVSTFAQVSYGDRSFGDYNIKINVSTENDSIFLNLILTSWKYKITETPRLLLKLMDDSVISLEGKLINSYYENDGGIVIGNMIESSSEYITISKFPISKIDIEKFIKGIKKLRLNTTPKYHEKNWSRDKIGKKLLKRYKECGSTSFEDNF